MKPVFITTENVIAFLKMAELVVENPDPSFGVVIGSAGLGKTECAKWYAIQNNGVYVLQDPTWTPRAMLSEISREYGGTGKGNSNSLLVELCQMALDVRKVIIIDEIDQVPWKLVKIARSLVDKAGLPVILIGEPIFAVKLAKEKRFWSRCLNQVVEFGAITPVDIACFASQACDISLMHDAAVYLFEKSRGDFRIIRQHMRVIERGARVNRIQEVDSKFIKAALKSRKKGGEKVNGKNTGTKTKDTGKAIA